MHCMSNEFGADSLSNFSFAARTHTDSRVWNSLPRHVMSAQSLPVFCHRLKAYLFRRSFPRLFCCARTVTLVILETLIVLTYLLTDTETPGYRCQ